MTFAFLHHILYDSDSEDNFLPKTSSFLFRGREKRIEQKNSDVVEKKTL